MAFKDAQEMHRLYPDTFYAPDADELANIAPGDSVKVCTADERFWIYVKAADDGIITGMVDNDLINCDEHGLKYGDIVQFEGRHVYDILKADIAAIGPKGRSISRRIR